MKRLVNDRRQFINILDQPIVFGARPGNPDSVAFLKRIRADQRRWHLSGYANNRNRIHQRILQGGHRIGRPRP